MVRPKPYATLRRITCSAPAVYENRRAAPWLCFWPIPIRNQHQIIKRVRSGHVFCGALEWQAGHLIVFRVLWVIAPQMVWSDRAGEGGRRPHAVRPEKDIHDGVSADRRRTVAFLFVGSYATTPNSTGIQLAAKPKTFTGQNQIGRCQRM
jgi:hypothetical protein